MRESDTYQAILEEGVAIGEARALARGEATAEVQGWRNALLLLGSKRFGQPDETTLATIEAITTLEQMEQLIDQLLEAKSWAELLNGA